ncbi:hypothetical protein [Mongoliibacter ruber]|uniref:Uncharacterized protein n=1 Tax=Mongoliibacter ruber TaxID=1750599 RepID=A0A2T0WVK2_9BACT|nr:hypothetical protein [Mongoliibacter ruber]PRY90614.1 hypothetical protein CLW00_101278 [Mongoliibacter ruber]
MFEEIRKKAEQEPENLEALKSITEPPCKHCHYFKPFIPVDYNGTTQRIRLCRHSTMVQTFTCFKEREEVSNA